MSDENNLYELTIIGQGGKRVKIEVEPNASIRTVKEKAIPLVNIPLERLLLVFYGKHLAEGKTIRDYNIENKSTLHAINTPYSFQLKGMKWSTFSSVQPSFHFFL